MGASWETRPSFVFIPLTSLHFCSQNDHNDHSNRETCSQGTGRKAIFTKVNPSEEIKIRRTKLKKKNSTKYFKKRTKMALTLAQPLKKTCSLVGRLKSRDKNHPKLTKTSQNHPFAHLHIVHSLFPKDFAFYLNKEKPHDSITFDFSSCLSWVQTNIIQPRVSANKLLLTLSQKSHY